MSWYVVSWYFESFTCTVSRPWTTVTHFAESDAEKGHEKSTISSYTVSDVSYGTCLSLLSHYQIVFGMRMGKILRETSPLELNDILEFVKK